MGVGNVDAQQHFLRLDNVASVAGEKVLVHHQLPLPTICRRERVKGEFSAELQVRKLTR